jgi:hypothetical protein
MKTRIIIEIETNFKPIYDDQDREYEITKDAEKEFHEHVHQYFEEKLTGDEEIVEHVMDAMEIQPKGYDEFNDYGEVTMRITQNKVEEK